LPKKKTLLLVQLHLKIPLKMKILTIQKILFILISQPLLINLKENQEKHSKMKIPISLNQLKKIKKINQKPIIFPLIK
jgi:hypothetical protein